MSSNNIGNMIRPNENLMEVGSMGFPRTTVVIFCWKMMGGRVASLPLVGSLVGFSPVWCAKLADLWTMLPPPWDTSRNESKKHLEKKQVERVTHTRMWTLVLTITIIVINDTFITITIIKWWLMSSCLCVFVSFLPFWTAVFFASPYLVLFTWLLRCQARLGFALHPSQDHSKSINSLLFPWKKHL